MSALSPSHKKNERSRVVFATPWLRILEKYIRVQGKTESFYVVDGSRRIAATLAIDSKDRVYLVRQHRPAVNRKITSIPGGAIDNGETPLQGAKRELREEAGLVAKYWKPMFTMYQDPGRSTAKKWLFLARDVRLIRSTRDRSERTTRIVVPFQRLVHDVLRGKHYEPTLIVAVLWYYLNDRKIQSHEGMRKLKDY